MTEPLHPVAPRQDAPPPPPDSHNLNQIVTDYLVKRGYGATLERFSDEISPEKQLSDVKREPLLVIASTISRDGSRGLSIEQDGNLIAFFRKLEGPSHQYTELNDEHPKLQTTGNREHPRTDQSDASAVEMPMEYPAPKRRRLTNHHGARDSALARNDDRASSSLDSIPSTITPEPPNDPFAHLYCVQCSSPHHDDEMFSDMPILCSHDIIPVDPKEGREHLTGHIPIVDLEDFRRRRPALRVVIIDCFTCPNRRIRPHHDITSYATEENRLRRPDNLGRTIIAIINGDLVRLLEQSAKFPLEAIGSRRLLNSLGFHHDIMCTVWPYPFIWHHRTELQAMSKRKINLQDKKSLKNILDASVNSPTAKAAKTGQLLMQGRVNRDILELIYQPNQIVIYDPRNNDTEPAAYVVKSFVAGSLTMWSWAFDGNTFIRRERHIDVTLRHLETVATTELVCFPLDHGSNDLVEKLRFRVLEP